MYPAPNLVSAASPGRTASLGRVAALGAALVLAVLAPTSFATPAHAVETPRVGKAAPEAFSFVPLDIGIRKGLLAKHGIEIEESAFAGDARMQQAMASDSLDIALGSGSAMAFIVKGSAIEAIAALGDAPLLLTLWCAPTTA